MSEPVPLDASATRHPDVSIVVPAHNEVMLIGSTVTNLVTGLEQRGRNFEIVVIENGSHDGTLRLSRLLAAQLPAVRVVSLPHRGLRRSPRAGVAPRRRDHRRDL